MLGTLNITKVLTVKKPSRFGKTGGKVLKKNANFARAKMSSSACLKLPGRRPLREFQASSKGSRSSGDRAAAF
jgi:hypothetical protein